MTSTKRIPRAQRMTPRTQPEPYGGKPYVRPLLSQLLLDRAEWWIAPEDFSEPHITATAHMESLHAVEGKFYGAGYLGDWFQYQSWLCLFEANFQLTDGEG